MPQIETDWKLSLDSFGLSQIVFWLFLTELLIRLNTGQNYSDSFALKIQFRSIRIWIDSDSFDLKTCFGLVQIHSDLRLRLNRINFLPFFIKRDTKSFMDWLGTTRNVSQNRFRNSHLGLNRIGNLVWIHLDYLDFWLFLTELLIRMNTGQNYSDSFSFIIQFRSIRIRIDSFSFDLKTCFRLVQIHSDLRLRLNRINFLLFFIKQDTKRFMDWLGITRNVL